MIDSHQVAVEEKSIHRFRAEARLGRVLTTIEAEKGGHYRDIFSLLSHSAMEVRSWVPVLVGWMEVGE